LNKAALMSGFCAGIIESLVLCPQDVLKIFQQVLS